MSNLINMLKELDLEKNSIQDIGIVLDFVANELEKKQKIMISFIKETREYMHDGIDEELIDMLK